MPGIDSIAITAHRTKPKVSGRTIWRTTGFTTGLAVVVTGGSGGTTKEGRPGAPTLSCRDAVNDELERGVSWLHFGGGQQEWTLCEEGRRRAGVPGWLAMGSIWMITNSRVRGCTRWFRQKHCQGIPVVYRCICRPLQSSVRPSASSIGPFTWIGSLHHCGVFQIPWHHR